MKMQPGEEKYLGAFNKKQCGEKLFAFRYYIIIIDIYVSNHYNIGVKIYIR